MKIIDKDDEVELSGEISRLYDQVIARVTDEAKWTTFIEQLTALDQQLGDLMKEKPERAEFECELTDISKKETLNKILELFQGAL